MTINYDKAADAIYLLFKKGKVAKTVPVNALTNVDLNSRGETIGIELLRASTQQAQLEKYVGHGFPIKITKATPVAT